MQEIQETHRQELQQLQAENARLQALLTSVGATAKVDYREVRDRVLVRFKAQKLRKESKSRFQDLLDAFIKELPTPVSTPPTTDNQHLTSEALRYENYSWDEWAKLVEQAERVKIIRNS